MAKKGCLGKDGKYSVENCVDKAQGIGQLTGQGSATVTNTSGQTTTVTNNG